MTTRRLVLSMKFLPSDTLKIYISRDDKPIAKVRAVEVQATREMAGIYTMGQNKPINPARCLCGALVIDDPTEYMINNLFLTPWNLVFEGDVNVTIKDCELFVEGNFEDTSKEINKQRTWISPRREYPREFIELIVGK